MPVVETPILIKPTRPLPGRVGIIGAGTIGPDIGYYLKSAIPDLTLVLIDISEEALDKAINRINAYADKGVTRGKLSEAQADAVRRNLIATTDYQELAGCDWVIEAATEDLELKRNLFSQVEDIIATDALITSNTSSIPAEALFSHLKHPERTTVTHFFAPAFQNIAVEVIDWDKADEDVIQYLRWLFYVTGKVPLVTKDLVCFMLDRIFDNWCNEAAILVEQGEKAAEVDSVAMDYVNAGPFFVLNFANGNAIIPEVNDRQMEYEGEHYRPAEIFAEDPVWDTVKPGQALQVSDETRRRISDRLLGILFSQSVDIVDRAIGEKSDLELGCRVAFAYKQGPLDLMRQLGKQEVQRILDEFLSFKPAMPSPKQALEEYSRFKRFILVDDVEGVKLITLRRPDALNAMHDEMTDEILSVLEEFENDADTVGFVITGYGTRAFCAGADIGRFPSMLGMKDESAEYARASSRLLTYMDTCKKPVVAALNGMALGGGLELAIRCRSLVATRDTWLQLPEITLGIVPGTGGMVVPYRRWPKASGTFHEMLLKAQKMKAAEALELGIFDALADDHASLIEIAIQRVKKLKDTGPINLDAPVTLSAFDDLAEAPQSVNGQLLSSEVVGILRKAIVDGAAAASLNEALEKSYQAFGDSALTAAAKEGISAFAERRKPDFGKTG